MANLESILKERGNRYGNFADNAAIAQTLKDEMRYPFAAEMWEKLKPDQRECLDMIAAKISRILVGDCDYADNWRDIAGYATLVADRLEREQAEQADDIADAQKKIDEHLQVQQ